MRDFAENELEVEFKTDVQINPRIDCSQSPLAVRLSPEEVVALDLIHLRAQPNTVAWPSTMRRIRQVWLR